MKPIYVTQPFLPPLEDFIPYLQQIWNTKILTNIGPFHRQFENELADYLGVRFLSLCANGTLALITALKAMDITGEVITTPYSFIATTHSLGWNQLEPVFVDIEPEYYNLDPAKIEAAITPATSAIMPVHIYGNPCNLEAIQKIADAYGLKVVYDAAHAFGTKVNGNSILNYGDISIVSFHATKLFNTFEGGAIVCLSETMKQRIDHLKNFGIANEVTVVSEGINGKMNEMQAALGLLQLKYLDSNISKNKTVVGIYREQLNGVPGIRLLHEMSGFTYTYNHFPIMIGDKYPKTRDELYEELKKHGIFARRYFYPLISQHGPYNKIPSAESRNLPVAETVSRQVLCLPLYPDLPHENVLEICGLISQFSH